MNRALGRDEVVEHKARYREHRAFARASRSGTLTTRNTDRLLSVDVAERERRFEECWDAGSFGCALGSFSDIITDHDANQELVEFIRRKVHDIVDDPQVATTLASWSYPFGSRRVCLDTDFYATFNRENVALVDLNEDPIVEITETGIRTASGERPFDVIVFATGFDAFTGTLFRLNIRGRDGIGLEEAWLAGPRTNLGLQSAGFPNLFFVVGPQSPSLLVNVVLAAEQHVDWILDALDHADAHGYETFETESASQERWVQHVEDVAAATLYPVADSYMTNVNIPGKPRTFIAYLGGFGPYGERLAQIAMNGYPGFALSQTPEKSRI